MIKFFRRQFWLVSIFLQKYYKVVLTSLVISIIFGLSAIRLVSRLPKGQQNIRIGVVGQFSSQSLPPLVKNILNSGLTKVGTDHAIDPNLVEKWEISDEGKTFTFTLKPGLTWSDGSPLKANQIIIDIPDVNISYRDDNKIIFTLPQPFAPFPSVLTNPVTNKNGLTVGDFKVFLTQNTNGLLTKISLQSKERFFTVRTFPATTQAFTAYKLGEIDALYNYPNEGDLDLTGYGKIRETTNYSQALAIFFNNQDPVLRDKSIRQGIAYSLKDKTFGYQRALGPISASSWAYNPLVKLYGYDAQKASTLIKSGLPDKNQVLNLELATIPQYLSIAEKIKGQLDPNLINLTIRVVTSKPDSYQLYLTLFESGADPDQYVFWHSSHGASNISRANSERLDKDLEDGRRTIDQGERKKIYNDFQRTFAEELPALFLFYPKYYNLARREAIFDIITPETAL